MALDHDTMINPPIEGLLDKVDSKFSLVTLAARRARNINSYFNQLGDGLGHMIPPQVTSVSRKPLSIGFEEISDDKIVWTEAPEVVAADVEDELLADADAEAAVAKPSGVLNRGQAAGRQNFDHASILTHWKRTRSPGDSSAGRLLEASKNTASVLPISCQPLGEVCAIAPVWEVGRMSTSEEVCLRIEYSSTRWGTY